MQQLRTSLLKIGVSANPCSIAMNALQDFTIVNSENIHIGSSFSMPNAAHQPRAAFLRVGCMP
jgi:hypothetical protein